MSAIRADTRLLVVRSFVASGPERFLQPGVGVCAGVQPCYCFVELPDDVRVCFGEVSIVLAGGHGGHRLMARVLLAVSVLA